MRRFLIASRLAAVAAMLLFPTSFAFIPFGDSNGCKGTAVLNPATGEWYVSCTGNSCGPNNTRPCAVLTGGVPGANFSFCGCQDGSPQTPTCCYAAVDTTTGTPFGNGLCYGDAPIASSCPARSPCDAEFKSGSTTEKEGKCKGAPAPQPVPEH